MSVVEALKALAVASLLLVILGTLVWFALSEGMAGIRFVRRRLNPPAPPKTRLTAEQVRTLVAEARGCSDTRFDSFVQGVIERDGRLTWSVQSSTLGSGWTVTIDDASGELGPFVRWGLR